MRNQILVIVGVTICVQLLSLCTLITYNKI